MKIGFLGFGQMGRPMVERLKGAGHSVKIYNRTRRSADVARPMALTGSTPDMPHRARWHAAP